MDKFYCTGFIICKTNNNNQCCICLETHNKVGIQCVHCPAGTICIGCVSLLCESGMCKICPVCRQDNRKNTMIKKTTIIPVKDTVKVSEITTEVEENGCCEKLPPCKILLDRFACLCSTLFISYLLGILTICSFVTSYNNGLPIGFHFLGLFIGIIEFVVILYCCYQSLCAPHLDWY